MAAKRAVATIAAGGGPEDPVTDVAAARAARKRKSSTSPTGKHAAPAKAPGNFEKAIGFPAKKIKSRNALMAEFIVCIAILGMGAVVPKNRGGLTTPAKGLLHVASKATALSLLFFILALISSAGEKSARAAAGVGGLVTLAYVASSEDAYNVLVWITSFYGKPGASGSGIITTAYSGGYAGQFDYAEAVGETFGPPTISSAAAQTQTSTTSSGDTGVLYA